MLDDKRQPRRRNLPAAIRVIALFVKIALVDAPPRGKTSVSSFRSSQARHRTPRKIYPQLFALVVILYVHYLGQFFIKIEYIC